jgi:hypothetical protein
MFDCRVHSIRISGDLSKLTWPSLREELKRVVELDEEWLLKVAPRDVHHQMLLPPTFFVPNSGVSGFWKHCDTYKLDAISHAEKLLKKVEQFHRRRSEGGPRVWIDARSREFGIDRSYHSLSVEERGGETRHRFCFLLPHGFHYDVSKGGRYFEVTFDGRTRTLDHVNVTPWGALRTG